MADRENLDDLAGAYYFARDDNSFEGRTPENSGCSGCLPLFAIIVALIIFLV